jgi:cytochrome c-type biogenesis protein CcmH/NrfF
MVDPAPRFTNHFENIITILWLKIKWHNQGQIAWAIEPSIFFREKEQNEHNKSTITSSLQSPNCNEQDILH